MATNLRVYHDRHPVECSSDERLKEPSRGKIGRDRFKTQSHLSDPVEFSDVLINLSI